MTKGYNRDPYRGISEAQAKANAEALSRRDLLPGITEAHRISVTVSQDYRRRQPRDMGHAVYLVRRAYQDEVPTRLHEQGLADDGTPAMTPAAEAYIFGDSSHTDARKGERPIVSYYLTPFRATLAGMEEHRSETVRTDAAIVRHVTIGGQGPEAAAAQVGVPPCYTHRVAFEALATFLRRLTDVRVDIANEGAAA